MQPKLHLFLETAKKTTRNLQVISKLPQNQHFNNPIIAKGITNRTLMDIDTRIRFTGDGSPPALHDIVLETATLYGWRTIKGLRQIVRDGTAWV